MEIKLLERRALLLASPNSCLLGPSASKTFVALFSHVPNVVNLNRKHSGHIHPKKRSYHFNLAFVASWLFWACFSDLETKTEGGNEKEQKPSNSFTLTYNLRETITETSFLSYPKRHTPNSFTQYATTYAFIDAFVSVGICSNGKTNWHISY